MLRRGDVQKYQNEKERNAGSGDKVYIVPQLARKKVLARIGAYKEYMYELAEGKR